MKTDVKNDYSSTSRDFIDFPQRDEKGRRCGVVVVKWTAKVYELPDDAMSFWLDKVPGEYLRVVVMTTRDGKAYGASQNAPFFSDAESAQAYISKRVRETERRYFKKYGS